MNRRGIKAIKKINWFPVIAPFNLLYLYSPPIDNCKHSDKKARFFTPIPYNYEDSVQLKVDIFPRDTKNTFLIKIVFGFFGGYCPDYLVRISFNLIKQRVPALLYWPEDKKLEL